MNKLKIISLTASMVLAAIFTFSCSDENGGSEEKYSYCIKEGACNEGPYTFEGCSSLGGMPSNNCPNGGGGESSSSVGGQGGVSSSSVGDGQSSSSSSSVGGQGGGLCTGFVDGIEREHYGKMKKQFCDERDGQRYVYVTIGEGETAQTWMAENLNYNADGSKCYDNDPDNCVTYGRLYDWTTAMNNSASSTANPSGVQGVCPTGWHLPSRAEWDVLMDYTSGAKKLKSASGWNNRSDGTSGNGTDDYGFSALPGGNGILVGIDFLYVGNSGYWCSASESNSIYAYGRGMYNSSDGAGWGPNYKSDLQSVRCLQD